MVTKACDREFQGSNVQQCLSLASFSLGVAVENLKYTILEEKNGFFKKHVKISIDEIEILNDDVHGNSLMGEGPQKVISEDGTNGTIEVRQGNIIIKNPKQGGKPATISNNRDITVIINGENARARTPVFEDSNVEIVFKEDEAKRHMDLKISEDKMEAHISISYKPTMVYKLKDAEPNNSVTLEVELKEKIMPPKFTELEIKNELQHHNITYGILKMNVIKCVMSDETNLMQIAKGRKPIESIDDNLDIKFNILEEKNEETVENEEVIDYKDIGSVSGVEKGQVLAVLTPGKKGEDGTDITGKIIKVKNYKKIVLAAGEGCILSDEFNVVAAIEGKPSFRGSTFFVYKIHEINGDVEIKTGNIKFVGDIVISGSVLEGMKVEAGNSILIKNNVSEAEIIASGDVVIKGNVIHSDVAAGKEDVLVLEFLNHLNKLKVDLSKLISSIIQLKEMNLIDRNTSDGELIKILLESKFKKLTETAIRVAQTILKNEREQDELVFLIKHKIINLGPLNIRNYEELNDLVKIIDNKISVLSMKLTLPVNVVLDYCQDSIIKSSGNIIFSGKGQYVSQVEASDSVIFQKDKSVARGGVIKAGKEIKCKIVGGHGGVATKLMVENNGHIWAEVAYPNTRFTIGAREYILDTPSKNVHAFIDESRELVVEKLQLQGD